MASPAVLLTLVAALLAARCAAAGGEWPVEEVDVIVAGAG